MIPFIGHFLSEQISWPGVKEWAGGVQEVGVTIKRQHEGCCGNEMFRI